VIQDSSHPDLQINLDSNPDVCRIDTKMLWIHYLVDVSHFAECHENRPGTVVEMLINLPKPPFRATARKPETKKVIRYPYLGSHHHQKLISSSEVRSQRQVSMKSADYGTSAVISFSDETMDILTNKPH